jgi:hypothetical protein
MSSNGTNSPMGRMSNDPQVTLEPQDFPPLTIGGEKKTPVVTGAWGVARPALSPSMNGNIPSSNAGTAAALGTQQQQNGAVTMMKQEENDVPQGTEPANPKLVRRPNATGVNGGPNFRDAVRNESPIPVAGLTGQVAALSLEGNGISNGTSGENGVSTGPANLVDDGSSTVPLAAPLATV